MKLTLTTLPPSTNHLYQRSGRGVFMLRKVREAKEAMGWEARSQFHGKPLEGPVRLEICLWWPDRRNRDLDNIKALLDALTGICWEDDGQIVDLRIMKGYDKAKPRVEMTVLAARATEKRQKPVRRL